MKTITAVLFLCLCSPALAAPVRFVGTVPTDLQLILYTDSGTKDYYPTITANRHMDVTIDPATQSTSHNPLSYSIDGTKSHVVNLNRQVDGTFTIIPVKLTITLDAFSISKVEPSLPLTYNGTNEFFEPTIALGQPFHDLFPAFTMNGHWKLEGPTQTLTGDFSHSLSPESVSGFGYRLQNFPNSVTFRRFNNAVQFEDQGIGEFFFDGMIDGASLNIRLGVVSFDAQSTGYSTILAAVPEPSTFVLCALAVPMLLLKLRRFI